MNNKMLGLGLGKNKKTFFAMLAILIVIPVVVGSISRVQKRGEDTKVLAANDVNQIVEQVGKLMALPNEEPTVATVRDASKLQNQEFFAKAKNDDKVIIFPKAQKAILFRPSTNQIIEVAFYDPSVTSPTPTQKPVASPTPMINLLDLINRPSEAPTPQISPAVIPVGQVSPVLSPTVSQVPTP